MRRKPTTNPVSPENTIGLLRKVVRPHVKDLNVERELLLEIMLQAMSDMLASAPHDKRSAHRFLESAHFVGTCEVLGLDPVWFKQKWNHFKSVFDSHKKATIK